ncbi:ABC transporter substrate-binding protein [Intrasporangium sp. YIM S08009]|uniref:ABC transporter substrate-binding protein n=1 Tax=Intrasporangium zincisolvens TaxID=3080018 RepID=UPI002B053BC4|nr:ABC transporter substrate-binding protein [Intrasporangium sp. YIM S08009]
MRRMSLIAVTGGIALGLTLSACGSNSLSPGGGESSAPAPAATTGKADPALVAKLPAKIKSAGKIVVGIDPTYAPNEMLAADGKTVDGWDPALFTAVAAKFGVTVDYQPSKFDAIILGVDSGKYDVGVSSFSINNDRKAKVNMVSYYTAGTLWVGPKGNPKGINPDDACGKNIGVQNGTTQFDDITARSKKCTAAGKPAINILPHDGQDEVTADVVSGKVDAMLADSPIGLYAIKKTGDKLAEIGQVYDSAPYGYVVPKAETDFAQALVDALKAAKADGTYDAALKQWGVESGGITDFALNP